MSMNDFHCTDNNKCDINNQIVKAGDNNRSNLMGQIIDDGLVINLPNILYATVGSEFNIYHSNVLREKADNYNINYIAPYGRQMAERFNLIPTTSGTYPLTIEVYEKDKLIKSKTVEIIICNPRTTPLKVMLIGDSLFTAGGPGCITQHLIDKLGSNIEFVGTRGTAPNLHEGRGGWKSSTYRTGDSYKNVVNPFYNPTSSDFDFSYYMTNNKFVGVDVVIIGLGINDVFGESSDESVKSLSTTVFSNLDFMINSIKSFNPLITVALSISPPPNDNQDKFGESYGTGQTQWRYKYNNHVWVNEMIKNYQGKIDLVNIHSSIDTRNNIADGIHATETGYYQISDTIYSYLNSIICQ